MKACYILDEKWLREISTDKPQCVQIMADAYGKKMYFSRKIIENVRKIFRTHVSLHPFAGIYWKDNKFRRTDWLCCCLIDKEQENHLINGNCPVYQDIRIKYDNLDNDDKLTSFFHEVLARRDAIDEMAKDNLYWPGWLGTEQPLVLC